MQPNDANRQKAKISAEFSARLAKLGPQQKVRAIVVLRGKETGEGPAPRQSRAERQAAIEAVRKLAKQALPDIDKVLEHYGGRRLADAPDALGTIPVETTVTGLYALAPSEHVRAILEDQKVWLQRKDRV